MHTYISTGGGSLVDDVDGVVVAVAAYRLWGAECCRAAIGPASHTNANANARILCTRCGRYAVAAAEQ